jgi:uncharacterized protein affecting Mg2+/Co2+ transport
MYERITNGIKIIVRPHYLEGQSKPEEGHYVWAYTITIENHGRETVTLRTRYWKITDAHGRVQEVRGAGVVGEQPTLKPGDLQYTRRLRVSHDRRYQAMSGGDCSTCHRSRSMSPRKHRSFDRYATRMLARSCLDTTT